MIYRTNVLVIYIVSLIRTDASCFDRKQYIVAIVFDCVKLTMENNIEEKYTGPNFVTESEVEPNRPLREDNDNTALFQDLIP